MTVLRFYGDESFGGRQSGSQGCYAVAGYIADDGLWENLADDWKAAMKAPPSIDYFHMSECFSAMESGLGKYKAGQFAGFSPTQAREKLSSLVSVIEKHGIGMASASSVITWDIFDHALNELDKQFFGTPYYLCVIGVITGCKEMLVAAGASGLPVSFVFDKNQEGMPYVLEAWNNIKKLTPTEILSPEMLAVMGSISFKDDRQCIPLQCADLLAWHTRRDYIKPAEDHGRRRPAYERLLQSVSRNASHLLNEEALRLERQRIWEKIIAFVQKSQN